MSARASVMYLLARVFSGVLSVATISLFARGIGPEGYAWLTLVTAGNSLFSAVLMQPVNQSLARFLPRAGFGNLLSTLVRVVGVASWPFLLLALLIEWLRPGWLPPGVAFGVWALQMAQGLFDLACQHANTTLHARRYAWLYIGKAVLVFALGALILQVPARADGMLGAMIGGFLFSAFIIGWPTWREAVRGAWQPSLLRQVRPYALPLTGTLFLGAVLSWSDRILLTAMSTPEQTGGFGAASDLVLQGLVLMSSAFFLAWYPRMVIAAEHKDAAEVERLAGRYLLLALSLLVPVALGYALVRHNLVTVLLGHEYADVSTGVMPWLALSALLAGARSYLFDIAIHLGARMRAQLRNQALCAVCSLVLNVVLIPRFGAMGAALASVATQAFGCLLSLHAGHGVLRWRIDGRGLSMVALGCILMTVAVMAVPLTGLLGLLVQSFVGAVVYLVVMLAANVAGCRDVIANRLRRAHAG
ncbi:polysaccharide biosynthesis C-terminal domain-containing protein [Uliginosibacterium sp. sgz301328]|uniref:polysaccharide biosynthesis C-terminal domain-containing protein n=1 Tax=Uliginosibacterium sp. sgz301328 TaxID=3243764 RepID=UPI00359DB833